MGVMRADGAATGSLTERIRTQNPKMQLAIARAEQIAASPYAVLIEGETGTGKELFAQHMHVASGRPGPFVPLNCSAVPESMFEAELFGAVRGAYTGLDTQRPGLFSVAHRGTIFLDEIGELPAPTQAKLLRVLEDGVVRPLGGTTGHQVDVRVIAATHRDLRASVERQSFRSDLYFRLAATHVYVPPLRERREDIAGLLQEACEEACALLHLRPKTFGGAALARLEAHVWPGNVRELRNVVVTAVLRSTTDLIGEEDLPHTVRTVPPPDSPQGPFFEALTEFERQYMTDLLRRAGGNLSAAAKLAGLSRTSVRAKARQHGLLPGGENTPPRSRARRR